MDIVKRLLFAYESGVPLRLSEDGSSAERDTICKEAADEIERLRTEVERLSNVANRGGHLAVANDEIKRLLAEVEALRAALTRIRDATHTNAAILRGMADYELQAARKEQT